MEEVLSAVEIYRRASLVEPSVRDLYQRAVDATSIFNLVNGKFSHAGCVHSSMAFTHGNEAAIQYLRMNALYIDPEMVVKLAILLSTTYQQIIHIDGDLSSFTPVMLGSFLESFPLAWFLLHTNQMDDSPNKIFQLDHLVGVVRNDQGVLAAWNSFDQEALAAPHLNGHFNFLEVPRLYSLLRFLNNRPDTHPILIGFRPR